MANPTQNLSGTWIGNQGAVATLHDNGSSIQVTNWGGPANPGLLGACWLTGGPTEYRGTWQKQNGEYLGCGAIYFKVINADLIWMIAEGVVSYRGTTTPWKDAGNMARMK